MPNYHGTAPIIARYHGPTPILKVYRGNTLVWSRATIRDPFDDLLDWLNETCTDLGQLIGDGTGQLLDGLGNVVGQIVGFVQSTGQQLGTLVSSANTDLAAAYCGMWGGTAPPDGLVGLINGIPLFGPILSGGIRTITDLLESIFGEDGADPLVITNIVGQIPVVGDIARAIGLSPDSAGNLLEPLNFVTDTLGEVLGTISCGAFTGIGGPLEGICFLIGVVGNAARMVIPDGLLSLNTQTSRMRHPVQLTSDDGFLETQVAEIGMPGFATDVFRRYANDGSGARGVGIHLVDSTVSLIRRVGGNDTIVTPNGLGQFGPSSVLRLVQTGNSHQLYRDGVLLGGWNDNTSTAATGAANRSVAMRMQGAKQLQGTRRYSPSLNYVEAA